MSELAELLNDHLWIKRSSLEETAEAVKQWAISRKPKDKPAQQPFGKDRAFHSYNIALADYVKSLEED